MLADWRGTKYPWAESSYNGNRRIYIATTGSDDNDGLAANRPMHTIAKALEKYAGINALLVYFAAGTYDIGTVGTASGGQVLIYGDSALGPSAVVLRGSLRALGTTIGLYYATLQAQTTNAFLAGDGGKGILRSCIIDGGGAQNGFYGQYAAECYMRDTTFINCTNAILAQGATVYCETTRIENTCNRGIYCTPGLAIWGNDTATHYNNAASKYALAYGGAISANGAWLM